jgi:hypothetical protein
MLQTKKTIAVLLIATGVSAFAPHIGFAQVTNDEVFRAESAIMSAGSRARAVASLKSVPSVGIVNLSLRIRPRFRDDVPDVAEFKISAQKNFSGISRLRAAFRSNPAAREVLAQRGVSVNRIVGVSISSNGSLRLYII